MRGAENGCAADVEVAAGGVCEEDGEPCRGAGEEDTEMGVALRRDWVVERERMGVAVDEEERRLLRAAARMQLRQIIVC